GGADLDRSDDDRGGDEDADCEGGDGHGDGAGHGCSWTRWVCHPSVGSSTRNGSHRPGPGQLTAGLTSSAPCGARASCAGTASTPASARCSGVIGAGASVSGSKPPPDLGKAMTSRIESVPASRATTRSQPN